MRDTPFAMNFLKPVFADWGVESIELADPDQPDNWPLKLNILKSEERERSHEPTPHKENGLLCKFYCYRKDAFLVSNPLEDNELQLTKDQLARIIKFEECLICFKTEVIDAVLYHDKETPRKWFFVDREIAVMYPLELRDKKQEKAFFERHPKIVDELKLKLDY